MSVNNDSLNASSVDSQPATKSRSSSTRKGKDKEKEKIGGRKLSRNKASSQQVDPSVVFPPPLTPKIINGPAEFGVLQKLLGTWKNVSAQEDHRWYGLHTTCMPSPGSNSEQIPGKFHFVCENYYETLEFKHASDTGVRNRGGTNEQFIGAIAYEQKIFRASDDGMIHVENGMFFNMEPVFLSPATAESIMQDIGSPEMAVGSGSSGPVFVPSQKICRSGTIPHGSTIQLIGNSNHVEGKPVWPTGDKTWDKTPNTLKHLAISATMGGGGGPFNLDVAAPPNVTDPNVLHDNPSSNLAYTQRIVIHELYPYSVRPDLRLRDAIRDQNITGHELIQLDSRSEPDAATGTSGPQGGVLNIPFLQRYVPATRCRFNMWIETVKEDGKEILQLQYEQIVNFEFGFGTDGTTTVWPHIQVNTLRKVSD